MTQQQVSLPEWRARTGDLPPTGRGLEIDATAAERKMIAAAYGVRDIASFRAQLFLAPDERGGVRLSGRLQVALTQTCIVSLRPVRGRIDEEFERRYRPAGRFEAPPKAKPGARKPKPELIVDLEEEEPPEPLTGETIDVAGMLLEEFALALDPYPRHPDAVLKRAAETGGQGREDSPFAVLRRRRGGDSE